MDTTLNQVEIEYVEQPSYPLTGIVIIDTKEGFFLQTTKSDIQDWVFDNGEEDQDFTMEEEWFDEYPEGGHFFKNKVLIQDAWEDQLRDYAFAHRQLWVQGQEEHG